MAIKWKVRAHDTDLVRSIEQGSKVTAVIAQILALRGITHPEQVSSFLDLKMTGFADPFELPGVEKATDTILSAIEQGQKIVIYGDYDCDGMTSTAILSGCIELLGGNVAYHVPNRLDDGYGLNIEAIDRLQKKGTNLIVTVDCGISSVHEVAHANGLGMQMIVTDHHHPGPKLPEANAIVHPALPDHTYRFAGLCGAGVAFKLAWGLFQKKTGSEKLPPPMREYLFRALGLAAIGTVADVVPLLDENRIIVHFGLQLMRQHCSKGLTELFRISKLNEKNTLGAEDIAFTLAPRLNAAGRLGQAQLGVELLITEDSERATQLAEYLDQLNGNRNTLENGMRRAARKMIAENHSPENEPALVLAEADWHQGVLGIVAGRIAELHHRPTILISVDKMGEKLAVGSCRSACGLNLYEALSACQKHLKSFGGHAAAAGLKIEADKIDRFREDFCDYVSEVVPPEKFQSQLMIDAETLLGQLTLPILGQIEKLSPFGMRNPRPVLCATGIKLASPAKTMGADGKHLSLELIQHGAKVRAIAFGKGEWAEKLDHTDGLYDFAFKPFINEFRGRTSVQLKLIDFRQTESSTPKPKLGTHDRRDATESLAR